MYCSRCGKELPEGSAFCNGCGEKTPVPYTTPVTPPEAFMPSNPPMVKKKRWPIALIIVAVLVIGIIGSALSDDGDSEGEGPVDVKVILDASQFIVEENGAKRTVTEKELTEILGDAENVEKWNYETSAGRSYPVRTLTYGNWDYHFNNDSLQRISSDYEIPFNYNDMEYLFPMFNLKKYNNTTVTVNNGFAYRVSNCDARELWVIFDKNTITEKPESNTITSVRISYGPLFEQ